MIPFSLFLSAVWVSVQIFVALILLSGAIALLCHVLNEIHKSLTGRDLL